MPIVALVGFYLFDPEMIEPLFNDSIGHCILVAIVVCDVVAVAPSTVYRVLSNAGVMRRWNRKASRKGQGFDQLQKLIDTIRNDPTNRRMLLSAWNPAAFHEMALPPCHVMWHLTVTGENADILNLTWYQRSADMMLGVPFNIASYGLLLELLARQVNMTAGILSGFFSNAHIYENHLDGAVLVLEREPYPLPRLMINNFTSIENWHYQDAELINYRHHPHIKLDVAV